MKRWIGCCAGVAVLAFPLPAHASTETIPVLPSTTAGDPAPGEDPVLSAGLRLPAGRIDKLEDVGLYWSVRRTGRCHPVVIFSAFASPKPVRLPRGTTRGRGAAVTVSTATGPRRVRAASYTLLAKEFGFNRMLQLQLPADVLAGYPRRTITLMALAFRQPKGCRAAGRQAAQVATRGLRRATVTVPATYTPPPPLNPPRPIDLASTPGLLIQGAARRGETGRDVAGAGDVNGDGLADAVVSSPYAAGGRGTASVVFGHPGGGTLNLGRLGAAGFQITGPARGTFALPAAGIGDLDGDGLGDLVVGSPAAGGGAGAAYVIRGSASTAPVDLARPGDRLLFKIAGGRPCRDWPGEGGGDNLGAVVTALGDANGDGLPDIGVLSPHNCADPDGGGIYIVFGSRSRQTVDVSHLGRRGIAAPADYEAQFANAVIAAAGDTNGDGLSDLIVGRGDSGNDVPVAQVIPGRRTGATIRLDRQKFEMSGEGCEGPGNSAAAAGDVNGDGLGDLVIAGGGDICALRLGVAYVVFGTRTPAPVDLRHLGDRGITIRGLPDSGFDAGVAGAGDVNGDGLADVAVADADATAFGRRLAGQVFLVPGRREPGTIELRWAGTTVTEWGAARPQADLGISLAGIGDFDGDGRPDLLAGAPGPEPTPGEAYVLPLP